MKYMLFSLYFVFVYPVLLPNTLDTRVNLNFNKRHQKLVHTFSRESVGMKFVTMGQAGEAGQRLKEIEFNKSYF